MAADKKPFFKTPAGKGVIALIVLFIIGLVLLNAKPETLKRNRSNNWNNNNYVRHGYVPPSLQGYI